MRPAAIVLILGAGVLSACVGAKLPFSKSSVSPPSARVAGVPPPLDSLAQAGVGAEQEIDFETLHGPGTAPVSDPVAGPQPSTPEAASAESPSEPQSASTAQSIEGVAITGVKG